jgi:MinD-like ATPase involved in chromosome partitioning or flagellar assembly
VTDRAEPTIALVFSPEAWVEQLHRHLTDHGGARVRQVVLEPELALEDEYDTLVVSHRWPGLTKPLVDALHRHGRGVLGVYDVDEPAGRDYLLGLGVDATIASNAPVPNFVDVIAVLAPARAAWGQDHAHAMPDRPRGATVVTGPAGVGASELALGLAAALAGRGESTALVDADEHGSSLAARLGLPIEPNLRTAVDAVAYGTGDLASCVLTVGNPRFDVVPGLPSLAAAAQVRAADVVDVVHALAGEHRQVVVETSSVVDADIARALLADAAGLVVVAGASPVGVTKLVAWLAALPSGVAPAHVVLNRAPSERYQRAELTAEISRTCAPASLSFVPFDRRVERAAWAGEVVARGPFTTSVAALAQIAVPRGSRPGRAGRRSRTRRRAA